MQTNFLLKVTVLFFISITFLLACCSNANMQTLPSYEKTLEITPTQSPIYDSTIIDILADQQDLTIFGEDGINLGTQIGDQLGVTSVSGDFNGDGFDDLLIGANGADGPLNSRDHAGEAYLVFGQKNLPKIIDIAEQKGQNTVDIRIFGREVGIASDIGFGLGDNMSETLAMGDLDGDGYLDIIIGAPLADGLDNSSPDCGEVYVIFGRSPTDLETLRIDTDSPIDFDIAGEAGKKPDLLFSGQDDMDLFGCALAAGDVNTDGIDDLLVGACYADGMQNSSTDSGEVYVFFGREKQSWQLIVESDVIQPIKADKTIYGEDPGDYLGSAIGCAPMHLKNGDVNGDGTTDVIFGARGADGIDNMKTDVGEAYLFLGRSKDEWEKISTTTNVLAAEIIYIGVDPGDSMGGFTSIAFCDVNADGIGEVVLGSSIAAGEGNTNISSGEIYILNGRSNWEPVYDLSSYEADIILFGSQDHDFFGSSIECADVDGDTWEDIFVGAPGGDGPSDNRVDNAGEIYIVSGKTLTFGKRLKMSESSDYQFLIYGVESYDHCGYAGAFGNFNDDDCTDLFFGAYFAYSNNNSRSEAGEGYVLLCLMNK